MNRVIASLVVAAGMMVSTASATTHYFTQGDRMYVTSDNGASVSLTNLTLNSVAAPAISSLAFDPAGNLWGGTTAGGSLYKINTTTGALTSMGMSFGGQSNTFDFRQNGSVLEIGIFTNNGAGNNTFRVVNAANGSNILAPVSIGEGNPGVPASAYLGGNSIFGFGGTNYNLFSFDMTTGVAIFDGVNERFAPHLTCAG